MPWLRPNQQILQCGGPGRRLALFSGRLPDSAPLASAGAGGTCFLSDLGSVLAKPTPEPQPLFFRCLCPSLIVFPSPPGISTPPPGTVHCYLLCLSFRCNIFSAAAPNGDRVCRSHPHMVRLTAQGREWREGHVDCVLSPSQPPVSSSLQHRGIVL